MTIKRRSKEWWDKMLGRKNDRSNDSLSSLSWCMPWQFEPLKTFAIAGMNHYHVKGIRHLFVAMIGPGGRCIKAEGPDEVDVFRSLANQAMQG